MPCPDRLCEPLDGQLAHLGAVEPAGERPVDCVRDEDLTRGRLIGQARGKVHGLAGNRVFQVAGAADATRHDLAAGNADMHADGVTEFGREHGHAALDIEGSPDASLWVVAVGHRSSGATSIRRD